MPKESKETAPEPESSGTRGKDQRGSGFLIPGSRWILGGRTPRGSAQRTARAGAPIPSRKTLENIRSKVGAMSVVAAQRLEAELPWFRELQPKDRSELGLVAQRGIAAFVTWYEQQDDDGLLLNRLFRDAPPDLARAITLQQALQVMRVVVEVVEDKVPELATTHDEAVLREGVLRYSRDIAFTAADVYARAAENRGSWDARLEALVVDGVLRGEHTDSLRSRVAALGWTSTGPVTVLVGYAPEQTSPAGVARIRRTVAKHTSDALVSIQGNRLVLILAGLSTLDRSLERIASLFGPGPVVHGPEAANLFAAAESAEPAHAALSVAPAWPDAPRPVDSEELWPERLMAGDAAARHALVEQIYRKLAGSSTGLTETLSTYVSVGHSLEATARELYVHANTVRYRLRRISDLTGWDPLVPRDAFVLHCAIVAGRLTDDCRTEQG
ncbi:PucR family transcriptional regulator [Kocuria coralli]|uniref:PucR family transcriptional regulator n=1 Tax=Kocuria coralli TaxID=1461025 RepID=A0A5J5KTZ3_9MICC|nr:helix-turn-helix domain-containing protein [Kocuria coralli]KAA9393257.1 PucR family transcriptional regulator [Kocuria coralli]